MEGFVAVLLSAVICFVLAPVAAGQCFAPYQRVASVVNAWDLTIADFNHDGIPDIALVSPNSGSPKYEGNIAILLGYGDGTFRPIIRYKAAFGARGLAAGDFDGDGNLDLIVVANPEVGITPEGIDIFLGNGDGTFRIGSRGAGQVKELSQVAVGDFNRDGLLDAVVAPWYTNYIAVLLGNGDGTMRDPFLLYPGTYRPSALVTADFNGDGKLDVASISPAFKLSFRNPVLIYLGNGDGTFTFKGTFPTGGEGPLAAVAGDFNEDGKVDLAVANPGTIERPGNVAILLGNGDGTLQPPTNYLVQIPFDIAAGDFNGDKHLDLVMNYPGIPAVLSIMVGNGDGTFQPAVTSSNLPRNAWRSAVGDFNIDGHPDLAFTDAFSGVSVELGTGQCP